MVRGAPITTLAVTRQWFAGFIASSSVSLTYGALVDFARRTAPMVYAQKGAGIPIGIGERSAAVSPKSDQVFGLGGYDSSAVLPLPAPAEKT